MGNYTLNELEQWIEHRSMGSGMERLGCGVMDKSGMLRDFNDFRAPYFTIVHVLRGHGQLHVHGNRSYELSAGDCFMRLPGVEHSNEVAPDSEWLEVFFDLGPLLFSGLAKAGIIRSDPIVWQHGYDGTIIETCHQLGEALQTSSESDMPQLALRFQAVCVNLQSSMVADDQDTDSIEQACHLLSDASYHRDTLRDWCAQRSYDYERFRKDFKKRLGLSPGQYRIRRRIDHACALLQNSQLSIADIANELGYPSPYEFSAQFKRRMGMTASQFRNR
ncbi:MAG: helix-turn-helix domain-containing protein [Planctomycetes bacterium]|nr:helix-turn-helix domain-containing protein [Planctomycetota bacterium]